MGTLGVVHLDLMSKGGGESVCMNVLEALQDEHDVTLITLTDPDFNELNNYYQTAVQSITTKQAGRLGSLIHRQFGIKYYILQNALLSRYVRRHADEFDLLISTINELGLPAGSIEYIHFPFDWNKGLDSQLRGRIFHPTVQDDGLYESICTTVAGITNKSIKKNHLLANSEWTADAVQRAYGIRPDILYPPVDTRGFIEPPWSTRESGFVTIGRIEQSKRIHQLINIIDMVRQLGYETHLHIIGPTVDTTYGKAIYEMASHRPYIHLEGELSRKKLINLICIHRYGIHGKRHEHFGMAVAEIAAAGAIPFIPATGGSSTIINKRSELQYRSPEEAVEKITRVLSQNRLQSKLRIDSETIQQRFGRDRFQERIIDEVDDALDKGVPSGSQAAVPIKSRTD